MMHSRLPTRLLPLLVACLLVSCHGATTHLYRLNPVAPAAAVVYSGRPVRVDTVQIPRALDRLEMLHSLGAQEYKIEDTQHWAAPLAEDMKATLSADLLQRLPTDLVVYPQMRKPSGALGVTVEILEFDLDGHSASMQAAWSIGSDAVSNPPRRSSRTFKLDAREITAQETVRVLSALLGQLADAIVLDLATADREGYFSKDAASTNLPSH